MLKSLEGSITGFKYEGATPSEIVNAIVPYIFAIAGILFILYLLYGGISLMLSQGDPKKAQDAQGKVTGAVVGLFIVILSYLIVGLVGQFFGVTIISNMFK